MMASWWGKHVQTNPLKYQVGQLAHADHPRTPEPFFCLRFFQATKSARGHRGGRLSRLYLQSSNRNEIVCVNVQLWYLLLPITFADGRRRDAVHPIWSRNSGPGRGSRRIVRL